MIDPLEKKECTVRAVREMRSNPRLGRVKSDRIVDRETKICNALKMQGSYKCAYSE